MYEVGKYYYNNLVLIKVVSIDGNNVQLDGYTNAYNSELLDLMGYYEFPVSNPEGFAAKLKR